MLPVAQKNHSCCAKCFLFQLLKGWTWFHVVCSDVVDVVASPLFRFRPVGEALQELVGLLRYQLEAGVVLLLVLLICLQRMASRVHVGPTLR